MNLNNSKNKYLCFWMRLKWYARRLYNYLVLMMAGTIAFEGVGAVRGLKPTDLVSAKVSLTFDGRNVLEITDKDGYVHYVPATDINIGAVACYVQVNRLVMLEEKGFTLIEIQESLNFLEVRAKNKIKYDL